MTYFASLGFTYNPSSPFKFMIKPGFWLDRHLFHTGYNPALHSGFPEDNHFGLVFYLMLVLFALVGTVIWSLLDKKRLQYNRLNYWFRLYIRYVLAIVMFVYGIIKFIPVQMQYPSIVDLLTPLGDQSRFSVLWNFMGLSPGYERLTGAAEIMCSLLFLNRRTVVLGCLLQLGVLINVVAFNVFYNVPVKMFSTQLLAYAVFLLFPFLYRLCQLFFLGQSVSLAEPVYAFHNPRKKYGIMAALVCLPLIYIYGSTHSAYTRYKADNVNSRRQKLYDVTTFVATDTLPPLLTDTLRWKRFLFAYTNSAIICNMKDEKDYYHCDVDSVKKTFTLHDNPDTATWHVFHYTYPSKDQLRLTGKWKGKEVDVFMKYVPIDSMAVVKEQSKWVLD